ncbi:MAG: PIN domain-containing protein [Nanoarchaeota archaeon]
MKEEKATDSKLLLDSSIWLAYLLESSHQNIIESKKTIFISPLSIFEIKRKLCKIKIPEYEIKEKISFIKERTITIELSNLIAEKAADISNEKDLPAIDSLIYATALINNILIITLDNDFRSLENAEVLD